ncbi:MAG: outer membrane beta-barrel domain-containing protein [Bacteriovoracaceae bacterium]
MRKFTQLFFILISIFWFSDTAVMASEDSTYTFSWLDRDKEVFVLQNRKFRKKDHFIFHGGAGFTTSGSFSKGTSYQGKIDYFFHEEFGIEISYTKNNNIDNKTSELIRAAGTNAFRRLTQNYFGAMFLWAPFYSKVNTFNKIIYLDWIVGVGFGKLDENNNQQKFSTIAPSDEETSESHQGVMWSLGPMFYLSKNFSVKFDVNAFHYRAQSFQSSATNSEKIWNTHVDLTLLLGLRF